MSQSKSMQSDISAGLERSPADGGSYNGMIAGSMEGASIGSQYKRVDQKDPSPPVAAELLEAAAGHMRDRAATYDKPEGERSMAQTVSAFNAITGRDLKESEGWLLLDLLKLTRLFARNTFHRDSAEDHIAYGALMAEAKAKESPNFNSSAS